MWPLSKKARTHVCFLLDETQSMQTRKAETIQGFNGYLDNLKQDKGDEVLFTLTTFNKGGIKTPYRAAPISDVKPLTSETYQPQNWTPLYDSIGATLNAISNDVKETDLVIFTILTDGEENSSTQYTLAQVKELLAKYETKKNWKIVFLGVGIDAFKGAGSLGIDMTNTYNVGASAFATQALYNTMAVGTSQMRSGHVQHGANYAAKARLMSTEDELKFKD